MFARDIRDWQRLTDRLYIWDYTTDFGHYVMPFPNYFVLGPNARFFHRNGVVGLFEQGVEYVHPDVQMASVFSDGTALVIHTDMRKTHESLARFSRRDADTWMRLWEEVSGFLDLMVRTLMYAPPIRLNDLTRALSD